MFKVEMSMQVENHIEDFLKQLEENRKEALSAMGEAAVSAVQEQIIAMGAVDTGELLNSITYSVSEDSVTIGSACDHAVAVHEGTSRMAGRPYMEEGVRSSTIAEAAAAALQAGIV